MLGSSLARSVLSSLLDWQGGLSVVSNLVKSEGHLWACCEAKSLIGTAEQESGSLNTIASQGGGHTHLLPHTPEGHQWVHPTPLQIVTPRANPTQSRS